MVGIVIYLTYFLFARANVLFMIINYSEKLAKRSFIHSSILTPSPH